MTKKPLSAGQAFVSKLSKNESKKLSEKLRATLAQYEPIFEEIRKYQECWEERFGIPYPRDVESMMELATRAGIDPNRVLNGNWTLKEFAPIINGYLQRLKDQRTKVSDGPWSKPDGPEQWAKLYRFSTKTLKRRIDDGKIRAKYFSSKSIAIHIDDIPEDK
jgi:hypothetical protein